MFGSAINNSFKFNTNPKTHFFFIILVGIKNILMLYCINLLSFDFHLNIDNIMQQNEDWSDHANVFHPKDICFAHYLVHYLLK